MFTRGLLFHRASTIKIQLFTKRVGLNLISISFNINTCWVKNNHSLAYYRGTYKVRNEIETKRNEMKSTKTKRNETKSTKWKRNKTKPTKAKRNQRKQNEIENGRKNNRGLKEIKPIFTITMLDYFPHMSLSFIRRGQDLITIEQEYYAFIQRESVLFT